MIDTRQLRKLHSSLIEEVVDLMNTDLLRNKKKWDEKLIIMNKVISSSGRSTVNSQQWRRHWDRQLYKALELQYNLGLESLSENLQQIRANIVYLGGTKQMGFKPNFSELKSKYYDEIQRFI